MGLWQSIMTQISQTSPSPSHFLSSQPPFSTSSRTRTSGSPAYSSDDETKGGSTMGAKEKATRVGRNWAFSTAWHPCMHEYYTQQIPPQENHKTTDIKIQITF